MEITLVRFESTVVILKKWKTYLVCRVVPTEHGDTATLKAVELEQCISICGLPSDNMSNLPQLKQARWAASNPVRFTPLTCQHINIQ